MLDTYRPGSKRLQEDLSSLYSAEKSLLFLLRHGQIEGHEEKRFIGSRTNIPLDHVGKAQALAWQKEFSEISFDAVYSSELKRCRDTAALICPEENIQIDPVLNEINMGKWDGKSFDEIREAVPFEYERRGRQIDSFRPPEGESFQDLLERVLPFFDCCIKMHQSQQSRRILVVTHAGVIRVIACRLLKINPKQLFEIRMDYGHLLLISTMPAGNTPIL
ncbi:MAG: histidine phosphatase family protein [Deltaproteobacteria bacterium]